MTAARGFDTRRAAAYDERSVFDKGDRAAHRHYVKDVLMYLGGAPSLFVDLGCGTGFFAEVFFDTFPQIRGVLVDASADMLSLARRRLAPQGQRAIFEAGPMEGLGWCANGTPDIAFSAMAFHFLEDRIKWRLFADVARVLPDSGSFILIDQFAAGPDGVDLLQNLACRAIQRSLRHELGLEFDPDEINIDRLVERDRAAKLAERGFDASLDEHVRRLREAGFASVQTFFQEHRLFGLLARKRS